MVEAEAKRIVSGVIRNSPELQGALVKRRGAAQATAAVISQSGAVIEGKVLELGKREEALRMEIHFLLGEKDGNGVDENPDTQKLREKYRAEMLALMAERENLERDLSSLKQKRADLEASDVSWKDVAGQAERVQEMIQAKDPVALKNAYRELFEAIKVGDPDSNGCRTLEFVLKSDADEGGVTLEETSSVGANLAGRTGFEPAASCVTGRRYNQLNYRPVIFRTT